MLMHSAKREADETQRVKLRNSCSRGSQSSSLNSAPSWLRRSFLCLYPSTSFTLRSVRNPVGLFNHSVCSLRRLHISAVISCIRKWSIPAGCIFLRRKSVQLCTPTRRTGDGSSETGMEPHTLQRLRTLHGHHEFGSLDSHSASPCRIKRQVDSPPNA
jgi:hypothetical protein